MMKRVGLAVVGMLVMAQGGQAQDPIAPGPPIYSPPGFYGTLYGTPSLGAIQTYSRFNSPFGGAGYGLGYGPSIILPGPAGRGLWAPNAPGPNPLGYSDTPGPYRTFRAMPVPAYPNYLPPFGYYAPALGPPIVVETPRLGPGYFHE